jgi:hypothetical protein
MRAIAVEIDSAGFGPAAAAGKASARATRSVTPASLTTSQASGSTLRIDA